MANPHVGIDLSTARRERIADKPRVSIPAPTSG
jgi:hypothetical protein